MKKFTWQMENSADEKVTGSDKEGKCRKKERSQKGGEES